MAGPDSNRFLKNLSQSLNRPVLVYVWSHTRTDQGSRCFVFLKDGFYERGVGTATVDDLKAVLRDIDVQGDTWVDAWIVCALAPSEVGRLKPSEAASLLYKFSELRTLLRGSEAGSEICPMKKSKLNNRADAQGHSVGSS